MYSLKLAFRNLCRNKLYSTINVVGLSVSLVAVLFISFWVKDELSYDRFHKNVDNIYMLGLTFQEEGYQEPSPITPGFLPPLIKESFGEIESFCRTRGHYTGFIEYEGEKFSGRFGFLTDSTFFSFFDFSILEGQQTNLLQSPTDVVISKRLSKQLFGEDYPIGKTITMEGATMQVVAVMKDMPHNTYFRNADFICSFSSKLSPYHLEALDEMGYGGEYVSFLSMHPNADVDNISAKLTEEAKKLDPSLASIWFQPLANIHLYSVDGSVSGIFFVRMFVLIAAIILIIACINYVSLVTARATKRMREIGLKKIAGAQKYQIFINLLTEAALLFIFAIIVAAILAILFLPLYNQLSGKQLAFNLLDPSLWLIFGGSFLAITLIAGVYPAVLLASYKPFTFLKGGTSTRGTNTAFRKVLVVVQFTCAVVFIIGAITIHAQMKYMRQKSLGFGKENIFTLNLYNARKHFDAIKAELLQYSSIKGVTAASESILNVSSGHVISDWDGKTTPDELSVIQERIDTSFINVMQIPLIAGKGFTSAYQTEYILNETAIKAMGIKDPIGKRIQYLGRESGTIVGVAKDFHYTSLHEPIRPLVMFWDEQYSYNRMFVRTTAAEASNAIAAVEKIWNRYNSDYPFSYSFLDDQFDYTYRTDQRRGDLFDVFTVIAILISCLGLFGLITYTAETKTKEIGIRKTLGASVMDIIAMLSKEFLRLIGIAILIAFPLAYYLADLLLQAYAYRISIGWWIFIFAAFVTLALTILTVSGQALRAARTNPVKAIKTE